MRLIKDSQIKALRKIMRCMDYYIDNEESISTKTIIKWYDVLDALTANLEPLIKTTTHEDINR